MQLRNTYLILISCIFMYCSCKQEEKLQPVIEILPDSAIQLVTIDSPPANHSQTTNPNIINTGTTTPAQLLTFARTLKGVPYKYASAIPDSGFDCSGFITYVFNHFGITVPRASASFTTIQTEVPLATALPGDLILFTGTDTAIHTVGHMGIIESVTNGTTYFIHASSGKANGVTISPLEAYYKSRFIKLIRVFQAASLRTLKVGIAYQPSSNYLKFRAMLSFIMVLVKHIVNLPFNNVIKDGIAQTDK